MNAPANIVQAILDFEAFDIDYEKEYLRLNTE
jgi:hypothetical protein